MAETSDKRIPALVVGGFLGAGKTTLVRHLLAEARRDGVRVAVVSNEFGELGIDAELMASESPDYVELEGGCVCCKLSDDLLMTLQALWERSRPDRVIVEASGVALPYDTLINFWREPVAQWSRDEISAVVVDALQVHEGRELAGTFEDQVASADLLILNKTDLVAPQALAAVHATLRAIEPDAPIIEATHGRVAVDVLFPPEPSPRDRSGIATPHTHEDFVTEELTVGDGETIEALTKRLRKLAALRVKGFVRTADGVQLVQGVGARVQLTPAEREPAKDMIGRLVVIRRA